MNKSRAVLAPQEQFVPEYHLTLIDNRSLIQRLRAECSFAASRIHQHCNELKKDPVRFVYRSALASREKFLQSLHDPNRCSGLLAAMAIVVSAILIVLHQPQTQPKLLDPNDIAEEYSAPLLVKLAAPLKPTGAGMGAGSKGRVGTANGGGEGSETEFRRARGGGGSGDREELPPQKGQLFQASKIPAIAPEVFLSKNPALPSGGINIDPKLLQDQKLVQYGDPRSLSSAASRGPGSGGNYGTGNGPGAGEGDGDGFGEGENGNSGEGKNEPGGGGEGGQFGNRLDDPNRILRIPEVTQRPKLLAKPEPQYTEDARRAATVGTVVLRVVFSHSGQVTNIRAITTLPFGLTERAIAAARQIRFLPALKGGRPVSVYIQLEYNFNLY